VRVKESNKGEFWGNKKARSLQSALFVLSACILQTYLLLSSFGLASLTLIALPSKSFPSN